MICHVTAVICLFIIQENKKRKKRSKEKKYLIKKNKRKMLVSKYCYELKSLGLDKRTTLVLSNTRKLDRELFYKLVYLI